MASPYSIKCIEECGVFYIPAGPELSMRCSLLGEAMATYGHYYEQHDKLWGDDDLEESDSSEWSTSSASSESESSSDKNAKIILDRLANAAKAVAGNPYECSGAGPAVSSGSSKKRKVKKPKQSKSRSFDQNKKPRPMSLEED